MFLEELEFLALAYMPLHELVEEVSASSRYNNGTYQGIMLHDLVIILLAFFLYSADKVSSIILHGVSSLSSRISFYSIYKEQDKFSHALVRDS